MCPWRAHGASATLAARSTPWLHARRPGYTLDALATRSTPWLHARRPAYNARRPAYTLAALAARSTPWLHARRPAYNARRPGCTLDALPTTLAALPTTLDALPTTLDALPTTLDALPTTLDALPTRSTPWLHARRPGCTLDALPTRSTSWTPPLMLADGFERALTSSTVRPRRSTDASTAVAKPGHCAGQAEARVFSDIRSNRRYRNRAGALSCTP
ncbi:hypothetical protein I545_6343 [Mycobacterium kansasii 662]|uniref:Uncharacterized protein n=2 Tax=Mycobacterium kansasii TaxID=1768 RepID=A0A1V3WE59_MYCKA|nr:hypothetical protein I547_7290 [Mycobacterium kansasii 824]EUA07793.1 hypothetical protein I545_6343 [Mycobacterium kansasii 662]OOK64716.1 hypothetical protein BZL29_8064 [Mycobacterium kansasii]OOK73856.1 hypothetical protein BZL30_4413 [Mycobacterium kansasii]